MLSFSLAMFYVIALAGAHKRVINQLREQLVVVCIVNKMQIACLPFKALCTEMCHLWTFNVLQEGKDKRFLIQKLCQAQGPRSTSSVSGFHPGSPSRLSPSYHTSFSSNYNDAVFLTHPPPNSATPV